MFVYIKKSLSSNESVKIELSEQCQFDTFIYNGNLGNLLHNEDGPAAVDNKSIRYYSNGLLHRFNGPALSFNADGDAADRKQYYINGRYYDSRDRAADFVLEAMSSDGFSEGDLVMLLTDETSEIRKAAERIYKIIQKGMIK